MKYPNWKASVGASWSVSALLAKGMKFSSKMAEFRLEVITFFEL